MKLILVAACASAALAAGCSHSHPSAKADSANAHYITPPPPLDIVHQRDLLIDADRQIRHLQTARAETRDPSLRRLIDNDARRIAAWRDALIDALTVGNGKPNGRRVRIYASNLDRAVRAG